MLRESERENKPFIESVVHGKVGMWLVSILDVLNTLVKLQQGQGSSLTINLPLWKLLYFNGQI